MGDRLRQYALSPRMMTRLFQKLEQRAQVVQPGSQSTPTNQCNLQEVRSKIAAAKRNLAFASFQAAFSAVESALTDLLEQERVLSQQMPLAAKTRQVQLEFCRTSETAVDRLHSLPRLSDDVNNLGAVGQLVQALDGQLSLRFTKVQRVKRLENRVAGGKPARARELRRRGLTIAEISQALGVSRNTVFVYLRGSDKVTG